MKRRHALKVAGAGAMSMLAAPALAQPQPQISWRLVSSLPKSLETLWGGSERLSRTVADATDGRFRIQPFAAGEIVPGLQVLDAVSANTVECGHTFSSYYVGKHPAFIFGTALPFGMNPRQMNAWLTIGGGNELLNAFYRDYNIYSLPSGNTGVQMGGWFRREVSTVADLRGLKFRITGLGGEILRRLGAVPQAIAAGDVYPALERGSIDAAEFSSPLDDERLGLNRIARHYYYPGWWDCGTLLSLMINREKWEALPEAYKSILRQATAEVHLWMQAKYDGENPAALRRLVAAGAVLRPFSGEILEESYRVAQEYYQELSSSNSAFKTLHDSYVSFRNEQYLWWQVAEYSFDTLMIRARARRS